MNHTNLVKNFAQASMGAFGRIEALTKSNLSIAFSKVKQFKTFDLQAFILSAMEMFSPVLKMLIPSYSKRLWVVIYEHICRTYLLMAVTLSTQYTPKESKLLADKLAKDKVTLKELFAGNVSDREIEESYSEIDQLEKCLRIDIEEIVVYLVPLAARLGKDFNDNIVVGSLLIPAGYYEVETRLWQRSQRTVHGCLGMQKTSN